MAGVQKGLEVAFYLYPCGLFATLLVSQSIYYYRERVGKSASADAAPDDEKHAAAIRRFYARLIRVSQFLLSILLASSPHLRGSPDVPVLTTWRSSPASSSSCETP